MEGDLPDQTRYLLQMRSGWLGSPMTPSWFQYTFQVDNRVYKLQSQLPQSCLLSWWVFSTHSEDIPISVNILYALTPSTHIRFSPVFCSKKFISLTSRYPAVFLKAFQSVTPTSFNCAYQSIKPQRWTRHGSCCLRHGTLSHRTNNNVHKYRTELKYA